MHSSVVSTHSRPKAADWDRLSLLYYQKFQHTAARRRLKEAQRRFNSLRTFQHTAARRRLKNRATICIFDFTFQHTAARRRLTHLNRLRNIQCLFQHTAARRRLNPLAPLSKYKLPVSTHSRPKAADFRFCHDDSFRKCFNTQPPEGG